MFLLNFIIKISVISFYFVGKYLLPKIRDAAGQKGTGKWTGISALEYGVPVTLIGEAVFARCLSALKGMGFIFFVIRFLFIPPLTNSKEEEVF